jgi:hypothetical protein
MAVVLKSHVSTFETLALKLRRRYQIPLEDLAKSPLMVLV